jgi:[CysO sulfur-carrier protein]-S-L-cysteine hydrolase
MLRLSESTYLAIVGHSLDGLPDEACGLLAGRLGTGTVMTAYRCRNDAASARLYTVNGQDMLRADRDAQARGLEIIGVYHSHTHTEPYPSPTDVAQAPDPEWHYAIVSLREPEPRLRSYRIVDGTVTEEPVVVERR